MSGRGPAVGRQNSAVLSAELSVFIKWLPLSLERASKAMTFAAETPFTPEP
jgi:hypothetical protein